MSYIFNRGSLCDWNSVFLQTCLGKLCVWGKRFVKIPLYRNSGESDCNKFKNFLSPDIFCMRIYILIDDI